MNIYFTASLAGKKEYGESYKKIAKSIEKLGHRIMAHNVFSKEQAEVETPAKGYKEVMRMIKKAEVVVAEVSHPSTGVGYEIAFALQEGKPVVVLHTPGKEPQLLHNSKVDKLHIYEYSADKIEEVVKFAVTDAKEQMDVRFNFFVSPKIVNYLDWIAKKRRMPRAVYLRRLILRDMEKNKEFMGER